MLAHLTPGTRRPHVVHEREGQPYVYLPVTPKEDAGRSALRHLLTTFFGGSVEGAVATLIDETRDELDDEALERLQAQIDAAREEGR